MVGRTDALVALHTRLRAGEELNYDRLHRTVPPDLALKLAEAGVADWTIWRDGVNLFHLVDVADFRAMRSRLALDPLNQVWQARVAPMMAKADDYSPNEAGLQRIWSLRDQLKASHTD